MREEIAIMPRLNKIFVPHRFQFFFNTRMSSIFWWLNSFARLCHTNWDPHSEQYYKYICLQRATSFKKPVNILNFFIWEHRKWNSSFVPSKIFWKYGPSSSGLEFFIRCVEKQLPSEGKIRNIALLNHLSAVHLFVSSIPSLAIPITRSKSLASNFL